MDNLGTSMDTFTALTLSCPYVGAGQGRCYGHGDGDAGSSWLWDGAVWKEMVRCDTCQQHFPTGRIEQRLPSMVAQHGEA